MAAVVCARQQKAGQAGPWPLAGGALAGAVALTAARLASQPPAGQHQLARAVATVAGPLVIAASVHLRWPRPTAGWAAGPGRVAAGLAYLAALGTGLVLALAGRPFTAVAAAADLAGGAARHAARRPGSGTPGCGGHDRERMQWLAIGAVLAADAALVCGVLHLLVDWPGPVAAVSLAATLAVPLGLIAGTSTRLGPLAGRLLVHVLSLAGFSLVVAAIYVVIVLGLGQRPADHAATGKSSACPCWPRRSPRWATCPPGTA